MEEHLFPLAANADLGQQVTVDIERDKTASRFAAIKKLLVKLTLKTGLRLIVTLALFKFFYPPISRFLLLAGWVPFLTLVNCPGFISLWRETREAKEHLKSWDAVKKDYETLTEKRAG